MGLLDFLLGGDDSSSNGGRDWDSSVLIRTGSATMTVATGWTGKMSAQAATKVTDFNIRTMMEMDSSSQYLNLL